VLIVCAGVFWLVRTSPPATEAGLPVATSIPVSILSPTTLVAPTAPSLPTTGTVSVHVAGAVERAGVYELDTGSRVQAAIAAAGGATADADPNALNLAAELIDGTRVYVPVVGEPLPVDARTTAAPASEAGPTGPVDVNRATAEELDALPGVGPATAAAIVAERERNGPFLTVDELTRVRGIGPAKLEALAGLVTT
jgi:competence protein ComEA